MSVTQLSKLHAVRMNTTLIEGIVNQSVNPDFEHFLGRSDGHIDLTHASIRSRRPRLMFTTLDIANALTVMGLGGLAVSAAVGAGLKMFFRQAAEGGGNSTGNTAFRTEMVKGMLIPVTLECEQEGEASLQAAAQCSYDGTNDSLIFTNNVAMEGTPTAGSGTRFTLGPLAINGAAVPGVKRMRVQFGLDLFTEASDGELDPSFVGIRTRTLELSWSVLSRALATFGLSGVVQGATPSVAYLRKKTNGGGLVANATAEHIAFTMLANSGRIFVREMGASGPEGALSEVVWQPFSASAAEPVPVPVTVSTASAIA